MCGGPITTSNLSVVSTRGVEGCEWIDIKHKKVNVVKSLSYRFVNKRW